MKIYKCISCKEDWYFLPEDYNYEKNKYPTKCPLCSMSLWQMLRETFKEEGFRGMISQFIKRYFMKGGD
jgi:DNA-directed RNA polymerase subunit RPC12/RpoP